MGASVSLCMIVRDEESNLPACLASAADLVQEVIVVDTGSADRTKEVASKGGARVFDFPWVDDFAAARNESIRHATCDWIFWLDADERLDEENRLRLGTLTAKLSDEDIGFAMKRIELSDRSAVAFNSVRLFRNHPQIRWRYRVHEQIMLAISRLGGRRQQTDIVIQHIGYQNPALVSAKAQRNLDLLLKESAENADDPFVLFNLGVSYQLLDRLAEAMAVWKRGIEQEASTNDYATKMFVLYAQGLFRLGRPQEAVSVCRTGRFRYPDSIELPFTESLIRAQLQDDAGAERCLLELLQIDPARVVSGMDEEIRRFKARHNLALLCCRQGRYAEAELHWRQVLQECPSCEPAWAGLTKIYLAQGRQREIESFRHSLSTVRRSDEAASTPG